MKCKLSDLTVDGKGTYGIAASAVDFDSQKPTYLRITDINDDGTINFAGLKSVDDENSYKYILKENDIVFARTGASTGRSYFYQKEDGVFVYAGFLIKFSLDPQKVNPRYLKYYTHSKIYYDWVHSFDSGATRGNINAKTFGDMLIDLPDRKVQDIIVSLLKEIDDKIAVNRRICENLEAQAQALFKHWFIDFAPFKNGKFVESELGMIPEGLIYKRIEEMPHTLETGKRPAGGVKGIESGVPSIGAENIKGLGCYDYSKTKYITEEYAASMKKGKINGYELLIYKDGGKPGYFIPNFAIFGEGYPYDEMCLNEHVFKLDFGNKGYSLFAYFFFKTKQIMSYLNAQGAKAAIPGINSKDIDAIMMPSLDNEKVKEYCNEVDNVITQILKLSKESSRLSTLRDTLLPKLMSGQIKV